MIDWNDDLPKFLTKPTGPRVNNDGIECCAQAIWNVVQKKSTTKMKGPI